MTTLCDLSVVHQRLKNFYLKYAPERSSDGDIRNILRRFCDPPTAESVGTLFQQLESKYGPEPPLTMSAGVSLKSESVHDFLMRLFVFTGAPERCDNIKSMFIDSDTNTMPVEELLVSMEEELGCEAVAFARDPVTAGSPVMMTLCHYGDLSHQEGLGPVRVNHLKILEDFLRANPSIPKMDPKRLIFKMLRNKRTGESDGQGLQRGYEEFASQWGLTPNVFVSKCLDEIYRNELCIARAKQFVSLHPCKTRPDSFAIGRICRKHENVVATVLAEIKSTFGVDPKGSREKRDELLAFINQLCQDTEDESGPEKNRVLVEQTPWQAVLKAHDYFNRRITGAEPAPQMDPKEKLAARIMKFYCAYCPENCDIDRINSIAAAYVERESFIIDILIKKYGPEPPDGPAKESNVAATADSADAMEELRSEDVKALLRRGNVNAISPDGIEQISAASQSNPRVETALKLIVDDEADPFESLEEPLRREAIKLRRYYEIIGVRKSNMQIRASVAAFGTQPGATDRLALMWQQLEEKYFVPPSVVSRVATSEEDDVALVAARLNRFFGVVAPHRTLAEALQIAKAFRGHHAAMWAIVEQRFGAQVKAVLGGGSGGGGDAARMAALEAENAELKRRLHEQAMQLEMLVGVATTAGPTLADL